MCIETVLACTLVFYSRWQIYSSEMRRYVERGPTLGGSVIILCPGGLEHGGGIGRQMGYFLRAIPAYSGRLSYRLVDTRGPWFLGSSPWCVGFAAVYLAGGLLQLLKVCIFSRPCIIHANITGRGSTIRKIILLTAARAFRLRYVLHLHDYDYADEYRGRGAFMKWLIATTFRRAEKVLVLGSRDQELLSGLLQLPPHQIAVLPNAVPDPLPGGVPVNHLQRHCHLLFLGHLSARKGVPELLQALSRPELKSRQWRATLAGGGPVDEFCRLARELGIAERVDFAGWLDEARVHALSITADVLVLPSHAEGLAMSVLEGLAHGLAVVTTPVGAHPEVIEAEVSGLLVPPGDVAALAQALVRVIDDGALRLHLGAGARRRYLEKYDIRRYSERLGQLHESLLVGPHPVATIAEEQTTQ